MSDRSGDTTRSTINFQAPIRITKKVEGIGKRIFSQRADIRECTQKENKRENDPKYPIDAETERDFP